MGFVVVMICVLMVYGYVLHEILTKDDLTEVSKEDDDEQMEYLTRWNERRGK